MKIVFVLNAKIKRSFSRLRYQFCVISGLALGTNFKNYDRDAIASCACACCVCPENLNFVKSYERQHIVEIGNCDTKIYMHYVN